MQLIAAPLCSMILLNPLPTTASFRLSTLDLESTGCLNSGCGSYHPEDCTWALNPSCEVVSIPPLLCRCICVPEFSFPLLFAPLVHLTTVNMLPWMLINFLHSPGQPVCLQKPAQCCAAPSCRHLLKPFISQHWRGPYNNLLKSITAGILKVIKLIIVKNIPGELFKWCKCEPPAGDAW